MTGRARRDMTKSAKSVLRVGDARGFVIKAHNRRLVVTAAHCLPNFPVPASISYIREKNYPNLLGAVGDESRNVSAECLFVDPVADIAVLESLSDAADFYNTLVESLTPLRVSELHGEATNAWLLPVVGPSFRCTVRTFDRHSLWIEEPAQKIEAGMSGSPILVEDGSAIGVVVTDKGPHPRLASHLPGWLLSELGVKSRKIERAAPRRR